MGIFKRTKPTAHGQVVESSADDEVLTPPHAEKHINQHRILPQFNHNGHKVTRGIQPVGESGRKWFHPLHFFRVCWRSTSTASRYCNFLWPFVPAAIALHFARPDQQLWIFILNYVAIVPTANLVGFAGQELARKIPKVYGVLMETTLGSIVEIVLFMVLLKKDDGNNLIPVIQAAILGSILANLLLCLGLCFFIGGIRKGRKEQEFDEAISEVGSGLLLVAGLGLLVPSAFYESLSGTGRLTDAELLWRSLTISRITALLLFVAFCFYTFFQSHSHHSIYDAILEQDEEKDADRHKDLAKMKLTFTECIIALSFALACVSLHAVFLVEQIPYLVEERHVPDHFVGLILIPVIEKAAEHLTAIDEAWDNQMNFALAHVLGATLQTALLNAPLVVVVGWGLQKDMSLNFEIFMIVVLILAIIVVGNFLGDGKSNYLEGALCVIVYAIIGVATAFYPNPPPGQSTDQAPGATTAAPEMMRRLLR